MYFVRIYTVFTLFYLFVGLSLPKSVLAAKEIYMDSTTGKEIWWMSAGGVPYYTTNPFSPNGKYLIYAKCMMINSDGSNQYQLPGSGSCTGAGGVMGMWSHDSRFYYASESLVTIDVEKKQLVNIPNSASALPFYYPMISPDGRTLSGIANRGDISSGTGTVKFINTDGTNFRSYISPGRKSGGFDVTHGWLGNNAAWYLNNSQWGQYTDVPMVLDVNTGQFIGPLNVGSQVWSGLFTHPTISNAGYMIGGGEGFIAGNGTQLRYANTKTTTDVSQRQLTTIGSVSGNHTNFSPDGKYITVGAHQGTNSNFITVHSIPAVGTTAGTSETRVARFKEGSISGYSSPHPNFSPDGTKISFYSADVYKSGLHVAVFKKPDPPVDLAANQVGATVKLAWKPAPQHREIKEYEYPR